MSTNWQLGDDERRTQSSVLHVIFKPVPVFQTSSGPESKSLGFNGNSLFAEHEW
jgi:hypothetical protein